MLNHLQSPRFGCVRGRAASVVVTSFYLFSFSDIEAVAAEMTSFEAIYQAHVWLLPMSQL